jgi:ABC-type Mn2+/Zn2+ transport system ATPase subunit
MSWCIRTLAHNEFNDDSYSFSIGGQRAGDVYLAAYEMQTERGYKWGGIGYLIWFWFFANVSAVVALWYKDRGLGGRGGHHAKGEASTAPTLRQSLLERLEEKRTHAAASPRGPHTAVPVRVDALPFDPVALVFRDIAYTVPTKEGPRVLLDKISGFCLPGTMTALMGSSGAGKTTLMDVISGRKTGGKITGSILVNGKPKEDGSFRRLVGYVEQQDIHDPFTTVREGLFFAAKLVRKMCFSVCPPPPYHHEHHFHHLRPDTPVAPPPPLLPMKPRFHASVSFPATPPCAPPRAPHPVARMPQRLQTPQTDEQIKASVDRIIDLLELRSVADAIVGSDKGGLSVGERKRFTIGVELVTNPSLLFLGA